MAFILLRSTVRKEKTSAMRMTLIPGASFSASPAEVPSCSSCFSIGKMPEGRPHIPGEPERRARSAALLPPAIDQSKSFWERMGEFEGEGEDFFQKVLPFPLITYLLQLFPSEGPCQRRHNWWDSPSWSKMRPQNWPMSPSRVSSPL